MQSHQAPAWVGITYLIYVAITITITFGGVGYAVFFLGHSGWWFALSFAVCGGSYSPWRWHSICTGVEVPYSRYLAKSA